MDIRLIKEAEVFLFKESYEKSYDACVRILKDDPGSKMAINILKRLSIKIRNNKRLSSLYDSVNEIVLRENEHPVKTVEAKARKKNRYFARNIKNNGPIKVSIGIPTFNRNSECNALISNIFLEAEKSELDLSVFVHDDCSKIPFSLN